MDLTSGLQTHSCALLITGMVKCWGSNHNGQVMLFSLFGWRSLNTYISYIGNVIIASELTMLLCAAWQFSKFGRQKWCSRSSWFGQWSWVHCGWRCEIWFHKCCSWDCLTSFWLQFQTCAHLGGDRVECWGRTGDGFGMAYQVMLDENQFWVWLVCNPRVESHQHAFIACTVSLFFCRLIFITKIYSTSNFVDTAIYCQLC